MQSPSSDQNPKVCLETRVKLRIYPKTMPLEAISQILRIEPSQSLKKGELSKPNSAGKKRKIASSAWQLSSDQYLNSLNIEEHLDWMLGKLSPVKDQLLILQKNPDIEIIFDIIWWTRIGGYFSFSAEQLNALAELNLRVVFDMQAFPEEADVKPTQSDEHD